MSNPAPHVRELVTGDKVEVLCPNPACRKLLIVPADWRGENVVCGRCMEDFTVPQKDNNQQPERARSIK